MPGIADILQQAAETPTRRVHRRPTTDSRDFFAFMGEHVSPDRGAFTRHGFRPLIEIAKHVCSGETDRTDVLKPTQKGFTYVLGFGFTTWQAVRNDRNVGYFLPTNKMAQTMMKSRYRSAVRGTSIDLDIAETHCMALVGENRRRIHWLGLEVVENAISWPLDLNVYDEVDDLNQEHMALARQRLDNSDYAHELAFACGRYPGEGIHRRFLEGDQREWVVTCPGCRHEHVPEKAFPDNMLLVDAEWVTVCPKCHRIMDFETSGRFVAAKPGAASASYRVSALSFGSTDVDRLMREWHEAQGDRIKLSQFRSSKLAIPDAGDRAALTVEDLQRVALLPRGAAVPPRFVGVDTGDICHIAACGPYRSADVPSAELAYVDFASCRGEDLIERLRAMDRECRIDGLLIDQRPEGSLARAVVREFAGRAWLQQFRSGDQREDEKDLDEERFPRIVVDREEGLSHFCDEVKNGRVLFPATWGGLPFEKSAEAQHILTGAQREEKLDARTGFTMLRFRGGNVVNHWFMAAAFARLIARRQGGREGALQEFRSAPKRHALRDELGIGIASVRRELREYAS